VNPDERAKTLADRRELLDGRSERIWTKTDFEDFDVYRVPTELLVLNASNRRFRAEAQEVEDELGRRLDPDGDEESIIALLLDKDPRVEGNKVVGSRNKDTTALIADWKRRRQERPLWIRSDGLVSNGNRRLAMLKRLAASEGTTGYDWVDVVFMDEQTYDDETLFDMEAREQLTEGFKVRYSKMNLLLTLRDAAEKQDIDWHDSRSIAETAELIQHLVGNNPNYARVQLQAVKYMTDYLEWIGKPEQFSALRGMVERFRDVGKNMEWVAANAAEHEASMLELLFQAIQAGNNHPDIREIRRLVKTRPDQFGALVEEVGEIDPEAQSEDGEEEAPEPDPDPEDEDHDAEVEDEIVTNPPKTARQKQIYEAINAAAQASRGQADPAATKLRTAAIKLAEITPAEVLEKTSGVTREQAKKALAEVAAWGDDAARALAEDEQSGD
jgi:hypothetical protein